MPLTKDYQRFGPCAVYGCVAGARSNAVLVPDRRGGHGKFFASGCGEKVALFDLQSRGLVALLPDVTEGFGCVCRLAATGSADEVLIAAGYSDGWVRTISALTGAVEIRMRSHTRAISALSFSADGSQLFCGSKDKEITVVDLETQSGCRLKGHADQITGLRHLASHGVLISSSLDGVLKFWDLSSKVCFRTLPCHKSQIKDFLVLDGGLLIVATERELLAWRMTLSDGDAPMTESGLANGAAAAEEAEEADDGSWAISAVEQVDPISRTCAKPIRALVAAGRYFLAVTKSRVCEVFWRVESTKRKRKPQALRWKSAVMTLAAALYSADAAAHGDGAAIQVLLVMADNSADWRCFSAKEGAKLPRGVGVNQPGHRFPAHTLGVSDDGNFVFSCSQSEAKLWNRSTAQFVCTLNWREVDESLKATAAALAPGERHVIVGSEAGTLLLYDMASRQCLANIAAHDHAVTAVALMNKRGGAQEEVLTGSLDQTLKLWQLRIVRDGGPAFTLDLRRHVDMPDKITCLCPSPDGRFIAVALLDTSVRLLMADTLKSCLTLRGHSMPVRSLDVSSDSMKLVTGADDKTVRVWGLQFGDCQTSFLGHESVITGVRFLPRSDLVVSASKDRTLRLWDAAKFRRVMVLRGHQDAVTGLAVWRGAGAGLDAEAGQPRLIASAGQDHTLRLWEELDELLVLEEEEEAEREREFAEALADEGQPLPGEDAARVEHQLVGKATLETLRAAERIMESIDELRKDREEQAEWRRKARKRGRSEAGAELQAARPPLNPVFAAFEVTTGERYLLEVVSRLRLCDLERALLELPFDYVRELLPVLCTWLEHRWNVELASRCALFLLNVHHGIIISNQMLLPVLNRLSRLLRPANADARRETDFVLAGLEVVLSCK